MPITGVSGTLAEKAGTRETESKLKFAENQRLLFPSTGNTWCFWLGVTMSLGLCTQVERST